MPAAPVMTTEDDMGQGGEFPHDTEQNAIREAPPKEQFKRKSDNVYVPPAKRRLLLQQASSEGDDSKVASMQLQKDAWTEQSRVVHGVINRLNQDTIKPLSLQLFQKVNLVRMRGLLCKDVLLAATTAPTYAPVYAALVAVLNSKLPEVGELLVNRLVLDFRKAYAGRQKRHSQALVEFLAYLFAHQGVVHELLILQLLSVLLQGEATDDSVQLAVQVLRVAGAALLEVSPAGVRACLEQLRALLHEGRLHAKVEYEVQQLLQDRKRGFRDLATALPEALDLVEREGQITHEVSLDDETIDPETALNKFNFDSDYEESQKEWEAIRAEILGEGDSSDDSSGSDSDGDDSTDDGSEQNDDESEASDIPDQELAVAGEASTSQALTTTVQDLTEQDLVHLRRTIYLTIMSSATFEECTHKLARIDIPPGREMELVNMLIECCSQERTFMRYYGLIAARFCLLDDRWRDAFMVSFQEQYSTIHRLQTNKLRNVAKLFAHLLHSDSMSWSVLSSIHLNEDETTSSSRIFIKIVIQEMAEAIGIAKLKSRFETKDPEAQLWYAGMFPKDNVRNTRYAINFFTSIGLGPLTDDLREFLKNAPKIILQKAKEAALAKKEEDDYSDSSSTSSSSSSSSSSDSSSSSYTSSSYSSRSYSSRSSSSSSSDSHRRGRSDRKRRDESSSRSSSESRDSRSDSRGRDGRRRRRSISRSRSYSPPKEIVKKSRSNEKDSGRSRSRSPSPLADNPGKRGNGRSEGNRRHRRSRSDSRSRSRSSSSEVDKKARDRDGSTSSRSDSRSRDRHSGRKEGRKAGKAHGRDGDRKDSRSRSSSSYSSRDSSRSGSDTHRKRSKTSRHRDHRSSDSDSSRSRSSSRRR